MVLSIIVKCFLFILSSIVVYNIWLFVTQYRIVRFSWSQNGCWIPVLPFVGNFYVATFTGVKVNFLCTLLWFERFFELPGNLWFGRKYHYLSKSAEDAKIILNHPKCLNKADLYSDVQYVFKNSILLIPGEKWKGRRRYLRSAFNSNMINTFLPTIYQQTCLLIDLIKNKRPEDDHFHFFNSHAFMNFFLTSIGWMAEDIKDDDITNFPHYLDVFQDEFLKLLSNPLVPSWIWVQTPLGAKLKIFKAKTIRILNNILKIKKAQMAKHAEYTESNTERPLLELLLSDGYECTEKESDVFPEFTLFAGAATDTTGHTLTFIFTLLGMFPDIQQKAYEEATSVIEDREIDDLMLSKLIYIEAVINEAMRLFPTVPLIGRRCLEDIELPDKVLPEGANIVISIFHMHRNPEYWDNPLEFDPSRFLPENSGKIKQSSFLPFSGGPRNCIGKRMALVLLKITVAMVLRHYKITSKHKNIKEFKLTSCISMKTRNHLDLHFIPRSQNEH